MNNQSVNDKLTAVVTGVLLIYLQRGEMQWQCSWFQSDNA